ncbi:MAG TPA: hypothetical protein VFC65_11575 [Prolixibacteraceae bacterium]|nr:hypothetical protein [Prolixibacteraceae bacterium]
MKELLDLDSKEVILLMKETGLAATSVEQGLNALRKANFSNKKLYYHSFFLLSIGIERILKLVIIVNSIVKNDKLPENNELKIYGHNLMELFSKVTSEIRPSDYFLRQDDQYLSILGFLSDFAQNSRYFNLDTLSGKNKGVDPLHEWHKIQTVIKARHCKIKLSEFELAIIESLNNNAIFRFRNESDNPINTATEYVIEGKLADQIQGYSVQYIYKIINYLVTILIERSNEKHMLPVYQEFFLLFRNPSMKDIEVRRKKDWSRI